MKYQVGVRWGITNRFMSTWGSSALAGSLSSDGVTIKILVVIQPYTHQPINHEMLQINEFDQGGPELPEGSVTLPEPPSPESCRRKTATIYTRRKTKTRPSRNPRRKWKKSKVNT